MDSLNVLINRIESLEERCESAESRYEDAEKRCEKAHALYSTANRRMKFMGSLAACALVAGVLISPGNKAIAQGYGESFHQLITDVNALKQKTQFMSVSGKTTTFTACNVQIVNGLGATDGNPNDPTNKNNDAVTNGLGNLIIGYNFNEFNNESGSHNLILGDGNSYRSYGGILAGFANTISAPYASITGGYGNIANGIYSSISGGEDNEASGQSSSILGGQLNYASALTTTICGGQFNSATGFASSVAAGYSNEATGVDSLCLGGYMCDAADGYSAVLGGAGTTLESGNDFTHYP